MNLNFQKVVSIDKLSIVGEDAGTFETTVNDSSFDFIVGHSLAKFPYRRNFKCADGSYINYGTDLESVMPIKYEFNPNIIVASKENIHKRNVVRILRTMKYPKITRFDLAIDLKGIDLSRFDIRDKNSRKFNIYYDASGRMETLYIGARTSDLRIRIYDKAREQKDESGEQWWRIEAQLRTSACDMLNGNLGEFGSCTPQTYNPFEGIEIYSKFSNGLERVENFKERIFIKHLQENPLDLQFLSKSSRHRYKKILATLESDQDKYKIDLGEIYQTNKADIDKKLNDWLRYSKRNNVF